ncbi:MAG: hypothetical protein MZV70_42310 [Desulfobacterales bacterium]|nr:hypothetical protein [Desulfobacterales bacterium]
MHARGRLHELAPHQGHCRLLCGRQVRVRAPGLRVSLATIVGASQTLGLAGLGYARGLVGAWWMLVGSVGLFILTFWLAGKVRATEVYTLPELLKGQYGSETVKIVASLLISLAWLGVIAAQVVAAGKIMASLWPVPPWLSVVVMGGVFVLLSRLGGNTPVLKTDFIQFIIILAGVVACLVLSVNAAGGFPAHGRDTPCLFLLPRLGAVHRERSPRLPPLRRLHAPGWPRHLLRGS